jgi:hypothetical protein
MTKKSLCLAAMVLATALVSGCVSPREDPYAGMGPFERAIRQSPGYYDETPRPYLNNHKDAEEKIERMNRGY